MFGAILGDYLGSVFEKIPHKPQRTIPICTDDSYLTCAVIDWMQKKDYKKFVYLKTSNTFAVHHYTITLNNKNRQLKIIKYNYIKSKQYIHCVK